MAPPLVYNRIERINAVRFDQIADFNDEAVESQATSADSSGNVTTGAMTKQADYGGGSKFKADPMGGGGASNQDTYMGTEDYNPFKEAERDAAMTDRSIELLEGQEVDIDVAGGVLDTYGTADVNSQILLRNYSFVGFHDSALNLGASWQNNYRLMCFKYQFFMDDDLAYNNDSHEEWIDTVKSVDDVMISIKIRDNSPELVKALCDKYFEEYEEFLPYVDDAKENCAFDAFDQKFNKFFADAMLEEYPTPVEQPWFRMVATYITLYNLFSDIYAGDRSKMEEAANNILETIRPETGSLGALITFNDACEAFKGRLEDARLAADTVDNGMAQNPLEKLPPGASEAQILAASHGSIVNFDIYRTLEAPVIDHIGDYTTREDKMNEELFMGL